MKERKHNTIEEMLNKIVQYSSLEEINKLSVDIFGEKVTLVLKYLCPVYGGFMFSVLCKKMIKTTCIIISAGSILYVLMVS